MTTLPYFAGALLVVLVAFMLGWATWRRRVVRRRVGEIHAAAHHPSRRVVEVLRPLRVTRTGQLLLVVDVRTGQEAAVWLALSPPQRTGDIALLVWMDGEWALMDRSSSRCRARAAV
jgi:uncharacterized iron-regulated membrane protein